MPVDPRRQSEHQLTEQLRELGAVNDRIGHLFAEAHSMYSSDFRALIHIHAAQAKGHQLTAGELASLMSLSSGAVTYLVERLVVAGLVERESDPADRRKVLLKRSAKGATVTKDFFGPLASVTAIALNDYSDEELDIAIRIVERTLKAMNTYANELVHVSAPEPRSKARSSEN